MTTPRGIQERPLDANSVAGINFSADGMTIAKWVTVIRDFLERELKPSYIALFRKIVGMLGSPPEASNPFFDGTSWRSVRLGIKAPDLLDSDETLTVAQGDIHIQRKGSATATHTKTLSAAGATDGNVKVIYNFSNQIVVFGPAIVPGGYYCKVRFDGVTWAEPEVLRIDMDPVF